jgi:hypothetical protein
VYVLYANLTRAHVTAPQAQVTHPRQRELPQITFLHPSGDLLLLKKTQSQFRIAHTYVNKNKLTSGIGISRWTLYTLTHGGTSARTLATRSTSLSGA